MSNELIDIKSISELSGMKFFIPNYQRGYRWTEQQVRKLLEDIDEFSQNKHHNSNEYYCLQPLVVKRRSENDILNEIKEKAKSIEDVWTLLKGQWEVIDGQQRLTTIYLILKAIDERKNLYQLDYETRDKSLDYLNGLSENSDINDENIDFYHMSLANKCIYDFFSKWQVEKVLQFREILLDRVKFIWYESIEKNPIKVFTRLNIGKIPLTNAELIKALILNSSNFKDSDTNHLRLQQQEIASEWDNIEYRLHDDGFWLFLHAPQYDRPTRIDFIFDLIVELSSDKEKSTDKEIINEENRTFNFYYERFSKNRTEECVKECWTEIKKLYQTFVEWYNDIEIYHYVGYLIVYNHKLKTLIDDWNNSKNKAEFISNLKTKKINKIIEWNRVNDLNLIYDTNGGIQKTNCKRILLLHNIQTVINQAKIANEKYNHSVFYKFPFHLYKLEQWDVEHIDSNTENPLEDKDSQNEFLLNIYLSEDEKTQNKIAEFINNPESDNFHADFECFLSDQVDALSEKEKNQIWNFTLLDFNTNRSNGNAIFSAKRRIIISKDQGKLLSIPKIKSVDGKPQLEYNKPTDAESAFVPPCTKYVFMKYYTPVTTNPNYWLKPDAEEYRKDIMAILKNAGFNVIDSRSENKTT